MARKQRLDLVLVERGLAISRQQAQQLIRAGRVRSGDRVLDKPGLDVLPDLDLQVQQPQRYVSRGGEKLEAALDAFPIAIAGRVCVDGGISTGGFTDCLLQHGAARVHAVDVGTNQLAWKLRNDPRVVVKEQFNARHMTPEDIGETVRLAVMDLSFISLTKVLPAVFRMLDADGTIVCLIKPQFELERADISKGGIVRDPALHERAVEKIRTFITGDPGRTWLGLIDSPITGTDGNREFLAWLGQSRALPAADAGAADGNKKPPHG